MVFPVGACSAALQAAPFPVPSISLEVDSGQILQVEPAESLDRAEWSLRRIQLRRKSVVPLPRQEAGSPAKWLLPRIFLVRYPN